MTGDVERFPIFIRRNIRLLVLHRLLRLHRRRPAKSFLRIGVIEHRHAVAALHQRNRRLKGDTRTAFAHKLDAEYDLFLVVDDAFVIKLRQTLLDLFIITRPIPGALHI